MSEQEIGVYTCPAGQHDHVRVGTLWAYYRRGTQSAGFMYSREWLEHPQCYELEPALPLHAGTQYSTHALFGCMGDSAPDRWGRTLMRRAERNRAAAAEEPASALTEADFLLRVEDFARQGALRYSCDGGKSFLHNAGQHAVPPFIRLPELMLVADRLCRDDVFSTDLQLLLAPGSSLGGARPKASVLNEAGDLCIAKFSKHDDEYSLIAWEAVALQLAQLAGLNVPEHKLITVQGKHVLLLRRFDRTANGGRLPYISAMTLLNAADNESHGYDELADMLPTVAVDPRGDLLELWERIVFGVMISNVDDHLRNHGLLRRSSAGWQLSPIFDVNPTPQDIRPRKLSTAIFAGENTASLELAKELAEFYGIRRDKCLQSLKRIASAVSSWRTVAARMGIPRSEQERMASAFEHEDGYAAL